MLKVIPIATCGAAGAVLRYWILGLVYYFMDSVFCVVFRRRESQTRSFTLEKVKVIKYKRRNRDNSPDNLPELPLFSYSKLRQSSRISLTKAVKSVK